MLHHTSGLYLRFFSAKHCPKTRKTNNKKIPCQVFVIFSFGNVQKEKTFFDPNLCQLLWRYALSQKCLSNSGTVRSRATKRQFPHLVFPYFDRNRNPSSVDSICAHGRWKTMKTWKNPWCGVWRYFFCKEFSPLATFERLALPAATRSYLCKDCKRC